MAIVIEEEKKSINIMSILMVVVIAAVLFAGVYFFFFQKPELIEVVLPSDVKNLKDISILPFQPEKVLGSEKFKILRRYAEDVSIPSTGKSNPFLP